MKTESKRYLYVCACGWRMGVCSCEAPTLWPCRQVHLAYGMMIVWLVHINAIQLEVPWAAAMAQVQHRGNGLCLNDISHTHDAPHLLLLIILISSFISSACNAYRKIYGIGVSILEGQRMILNFESIFGIDSIICRLPAPHILWINVLCCSLQRQSHFTLKFCNTISI